MVLQDTWLFKGTIMENIRYGRLDATDEEVIAAAKACLLYTSLPLPKDVIHETEPFKYTLHRGLRGAVLG